MNLKISEIVAGVAPSVDTPQPTVNKRSVPKRKQAQESKTKREAKPKKQAEPQPEAPEIEPEVDRDTHPMTVGDWAVANLPEEVGVVLLGEDPEGGKAWCWIEFPEKPDAHTRALLKANGFRWAPRRGMWANPCGNQTGRSKRDPRQKYAAYALRQEDED